MAGKYNRKITQPASIPFLVQTTRRPSIILIHKGGKNRLKNTFIYQVLRIRKGRFADGRNEAVKSIFSGYKN
jgi:hypothetical protein